MESALSQGVGERAYGRRQVQGSEATGRRGSSLTVRGIDLVGRRVLHDGNAGFRIFELRCCLTRPTAGRAAAQIFAALAVVTGNDDDATKPRKRLVGDQRLVT